jgi:hypothetical protein
MVNLSEQTSPEANEQLSAKPLLVDIRQEKRKSICGLLFERRYDKDMNIGG